MIQCFFLTIKQHQSVNHPQKPSSEHGVVLVFMSAFITIHYTRLLTTTPSLFVGRPEIVSVREIRFSRDKHLGTEGVLRRSRGCAYGGVGGAVYGHDGSTPSDAWHRHVHIHGEVGIVAAVVGKSQWSSCRTLLARR
jgi:hypothetical protein